MRVLCQVGYVELESESGYMVDGVEVTCSRCQHSIESFGTGPESIRRSCAILSEECPRSEKNLYLPDDD